MIRKIALLVLLTVITATAVIGVVMYQHQQEQERLSNQMYLAEAGINAGDFEKAVTYLTPLVEKGASFQHAPTVLYQLAYALQQTQPKEAFPYWDQLVREYPDHEKYNIARLYQARLLSETNPDEALAVFEELKHADDEKIRGEAVLGIAKTYDQNNQQEKAEELYYQIIDLDTDPEIIAAAKDRLTEINHERIWSPVLDPFSQLYEVQRGDAPIKIGQQYKTTAWYVLEANRLGKVLRPGKRVKVPKEPYRVVVDKTNCRLNLVTESGKFVKWYPVGIGEQSYKTPAGEYTIQEKLIEPDWYRPSGGIVKANDPENALGTRWMGIGGSLGIHGTNEPDTIGFRKSAGCIRMYNHDAEELYKILTYGSKVTVIDTPEQLRKAMQSQPKITDETVNHPVENSSEPVGSTTTKDTEPVTEIKTSS